MGFIQSQNEYNLISTESEQLHDNYTVFLFNICKICRNIYVDDKVHQSLLSRWSLFNIIHDFCFVKVNLYFFQEWGVN